MSHSSAEPSSAPESSPRQKSVQEDDPDGTTSGLAPKACELCQTRKVRCDRVKPRCGWCVRNRRPCSYSKKQKPGPRSGFNQDLTKKVNRLEGVVRLLCEQLAEQSGSQNNLNTSRRQELASFAGIPLTSPAIEGNGDNPSIKSPVHNQQQEAPNQLPTAMPSIDRLPSITPYNSFIPMVGWPSETVEPELPPPHQLYMLVDLYFKHINTWIPMLDRGSTFDILSRSSIPDESERILLHALIAVSLRFSKDPRHTPEVQKQYHDRSTSKVQLHGLEHPNVRSLQALVIITVDALGTSNGPKTSNMMALITQSIFNFGLGFENSYYVERLTNPNDVYMLPPPKTWTEDEERRRIFWVVYALDRYSTIGTARYIGMPSRFAIDEMSAIRRLPCRYDLFSTDLPVETRWPDRGGLDRSIEQDKNAHGSFSYHCELLKILTQIHNFLNTPLDIRIEEDVRQWRIRYCELDRRLSTWLYSLPGEYSEISQLCHSDSKSKISNWIILQAAFVVAVIQLHSTAAYPPISSTYFRSSYSAMQKCLGAVMSLKELTVDVVQTDMLDLLGPLFPNALWTATRLLLIHTSFEGRILDPAVSFFMDTLHQIGRHWEFSNVYLKALRAAVSGTELISHNSTPLPAWVGLTGKLRNMRNSAHSLHLMMTAKRASMLPQSTTKVLTQEELLNINIFGTFNYPSLHADVYSQLSDGSGFEMHGMALGKYEMPNSAADWFPMEGFN